MLVAVVLYTISILAIMVPSFGAITSGDLPIIISTIASVHGITGILAEVLGVWIIASWRLHTSIQYCAPKKRLIRLTLIVWLTTLLLGIFLYLNFYTTLLPSQ